MDFDEAKKIFKDHYSKAGFKLVDERPNELFFKYSGVTLRISEDDIMDYADSEDFRSTLETCPVECSMCSPTYREQMVYPLNTRFSFPMNEFVFGDSSGDDLYVEIGLATMQFVNYFRFDKTILQLCQEKIGIVPSLDIQHLYRPPTIRVYNINEPSVEKALKRSNDIISSCLFRLSYLKNIPLGLAEEWSTSQLKDEKFSYDEPVSGQRFQLPSTNFNSEIIQFYQLGMSSDIPVLQFLAFYQVLEYFFVIVSDEKLYNRLSQRLNDPKFNYTSHKHLDHIIQDVHDHKYIDETEMLKNVLKKFVDETELMEFIEAYEKHLGRNLYTKRRDVFGENVQVSLSRGHVLGNIATTIKAIRNALVHSSDRYERSPRHIPFSESTKIVKLEIPLIKFLAEKVIIASAK